MVLIFNTRSVDRGNPHKQKLFEVPENEEYQGMLRTKCLKTAHLQGEWTRPGHLPTMRWILLKVLFLQCTDGCRNLANNPPTSFTSQLPLKTSVTLLLQKVRRRCKNWQMVVVRITPWPHIQVEEGSCILWKARQVKQGCARSDFLCIPSGRWKVQWLIVKSWQEQLFPGRKRELVSGSFFQWVWQQLGNDLNLLGFWLKA